MGRRRSSLPPAITGSAARSADLPLWGVGRSRLRHDDVEHPFRGANAFELDSATIEQRCAPYEAIRLPGQFYSHVTAAALYGIPLPPWTDTSVLHVSVEAPRAAPKRPGIIGHCIRVHEIVLRRHEGLPLASPANVWCQLSPLIPFRDLVAAGDFLLSGRRTDRGREPALATVSDLREAAARHRGKRGAKNVAQALPLLRTGVDSPPESHLRLLLVEAGLPEPLIGHPTPVERGIVLHPDLKYEQWRVVFEYEGDGHREDRERWRKDITRREMLEAAGWRVIRVTADDLYNSADQLLERVLRVLATR